MELEPLRTSVLTNMEGGQLMKRHMNDLSTIDQPLRTDAPFNSYIQYLTGITGNYEVALIQIRKNEETDKVVLADTTRDKSVNAFGRGLKFYELSDDMAEVEASKSLSIVFKSYKNLTVLNYEAETLAIDKLLSDLRSPKYSPKVSLLQLDRTVRRISNDNETFKTLFGGRMVTVALTETYDLKIIRKEMFKKYKDFCGYVLAMSKANDNPLFLTALNLLNTARKYYADMIAKRSSKKEEKEEPKE